MLRFAPSPTEDMSIGQLRVALFNFIMSKKLNEKLLIRIEDTEKEKNIESKDKEILELLSLFSIDYESVVYQSESIKYHQKLAMQLMTQKKAFSCFCSDEKLNELKENAKKAKEPFVYDGFCEKLSNEAILEVNAPFTVRIKKPEAKIQFTDLIKGEFEYSPFDVDSFIILRHDKSANSNYACGVDDMLYNISIVIREEKHLENTPKQIHIRNALGYTEEIKYLHLPAILNTQTTSVKHLIDEGFLPSAIANYLVLLGNNTPTEIFTLEEAIEWFDIKGLSKEPVKFDIDKLKFINRKHLEKLDDLRLSKLLGFADTDIGKLAKVYLEEVSTLKEIKIKIDAIFSQKTSYKESEEEFIKIKKCLQKAQFFDDFDEFKKYITNETQLKDESLLKPLTYILTGNKNTLNLSTIYPLIKNYLGEIVK